MQISKSESSNKPRIIFFADYNLLVRNTANELLKKGFDVVIVSYDSSNWKHHEEKNFITINPSPVWTNDIVDTDYVIFFANNKSDLEKYYDSCVALADVTKAKTLFIFPFAQNNTNYSLFKGKIKQIIDNKKLFGGVILLPEIFEKSGFSESIIKAFKTGVLELDPRLSSFLIERDTATDIIIRSLLSLNAYGKVTAYISMPVSSKTLFKSVVKFRDDIRVEYIDKEKLETHHYDSREIQEFDINEKVAAIVHKYRISNFSNQTHSSIPLIKLKATVDADQNLDKPDEINMNVNDAKDLIGSKADQEKDEINLNSEVKQESVKEAQIKSFKMDLYKVIKQSVKREKRKFKLKRLAFLFIIFFVFPFYILILAILGNGLGNFFLGKGNLNLAVNSYSFAKDTSLLSKESNNYFSYIPVFGYPYKYFSFFPNVVYKRADISINQTILIQEIYKNFSNILNSRMGDVSVFADETYFEIENLYASIGLLRSEVESHQGLSGRVGKYLAGDLPSEKRLEDLYKLKDLFKRVPVLTGKGRPTEIALILVDNRIRRPSGGVIEALGLLSFSEGNLLEIEYFDAAEADKLLNGVIEPPFILSEFNNIDSWYLKDSLMQSDYKESARQVQWFLEKEMERHVDGVIFIDLDFVKNIMDVTEPLKINDESISSSELFTALPFGSFSALEEDSYYKRILEVIINRMKNMNHRALFRFNNLLLESLKQKHVLIYFDDLESNLIVSRLGYGGSVIYDECNFDNCVTDLAGVVETGLGSLININKQSEIKVSIEEGIIKRELTVYYKNQEGIRDNRKYESYLTIMAHDSVGFSEFIIYNDDSEERVAPRITARDGYKEAGVKVDVKPGEVKAYKITWEGPSSIDFENDGEYRLQVIKQSGEIEYPVEIEVSIPDGVNAESNTLALTRDRSLYYNTQLSTDLDLLVSW